MFADAQKQDASFLLRISCSIRKTSICQMATSQSLQTFCREKHDI